MLTSRAAKTALETDTQVPCADARFKFGADLTQYCSVKRNF
jgi:hypothetical protein